MPSILIPTTLLSIYNKEFKLLFDGFSILGDAPVSQGAAAVELEETARGEYSQVATTEEEDSNFTLGEEIPENEAEVGGENKV